MSQQLSLFALRGPRTRGECVDGPRPCPWVSCRHHLATEALRLRWTPKYGLSHQPPPGRVAAALGDLAETCSLDVADQGDHTFKSIAQLLRMSRSRAQQIAAQGLARVNEREPLLAEAFQELELTR